MIKISPSTNLVKDEDLPAYAMLMQDSGADFMHCDVMDGKFVKAECLDIETVADLSYKTLLPLDVHLMVERPLDLIKDYSQLKLHYLTTHFEAYNNDLEILKALEMVHGNGILFGLSIKPKTKVEEIYRFLPYIDLILVMSVEPGKSGQSFMPEALKRIKKLKSQITKLKSNCKIEIDGGINEENLPMIVENGGDIVVMATAIYKQKDKKKYITMLKKM